jgi:hypothetical protein
VVPLGGGHHVAAEQQALEFEARGSAFGNLQPLVPGLGTGFLRSSQ